MPRISRISRIIKKIKPKEETECGETEKLHNLKQEHKSGKV